MRIVVNCTLRVTTTFKPPFPWVYWDECPGGSTGMMSRRASSCLASECYKGSCEGGCSTVFVFFGTLAGDFVGL